MGFVVPAFAALASSIGTAAAGAGSFLASAGSGIGSTLMSGLGAETAAGAASASTGAGTLSTLLNVGGDLVSGVGSLQEGLYKSAVAKANAEQATQAGLYAAEQKKMETGVLVGRQKTIQAASGIDVGSGSPVDVRDSTRAIGDLDAMMLQYNAAREAQAMRMEGDLAKKAGVNRFIGSFFGAGRDFLSGASSLGEKWSNYKKNISMKVPETSDYGYDFGTYGG